MFYLFLLFGDGKHHVETGRQQSGPSLYWLKTKNPDFVRT
jgi:hypothetical protein